MFGAMIIGGGGGGGSMDSSGMSQQEYYRYMEEQMRGRQNALAQQSQYQNQAGLQNAYADSDDGEPKPNPVLLLLGDDE